MSSAAVIQWCVVVAAGRRRPTTGGRPAALIVLLCCYILCEDEVERIKPAGPRDMLSDCCASRWGLPGLRWRGRPMTAEAVVRRRPSKRVAHRYFGGTFLRTFSPGPTKMTAKPDNIPEGDFANYFCALSRSSCKWGSPIEV